MIGDAKEEVDAATLVCFRGLLGLEILLAKPCCDTHLESHEE